MLKVVGASWLQTRISTYILVAVALLGIGAIVLGEFGGIEKDGTYSATVFWNHKGGYKIDFWGQGNDLTSIPKGAARAYYKTRIEETGWSTVEIETTPTYPDSVQAYAAGFLEGSLTWQLIHHHWFNTIGSFCALPESEELCERTRQSLRENTNVIRERAKLLAAEDPFWHMVRLFYAQLDGMEAGWTYAVRRSRRSVEIDPQDFLWLAMASDIPNFETTKKSSDSGGGAGVIFVKNLDRTSEGLDPILAVAQNTVAPYSKMLRLLKRYTFGYHLSASRHAPRTPTRSIFMSSYPGAVSSHDEYYVARGGPEEEAVVVLAGIPLVDSRESSLRVEDQEKRLEEDDSSVQVVLTPARIMAANRLSTEAKTWSKLLNRGNPKEKTARGEYGRSLQWVWVRPKDFSVWLIEQHPSRSQAVDYSESFEKDGFFFSDGGSLMGDSGLEEVERSSEGKLEKDAAVEPAEDWNSMLRKFFSENITSVEAIRELMRGKSHYGESEEGEDLEKASQSSTTSRSAGNVESRVSHSVDPLGKFVYRGDLGEEAIPIGVIDTKISIATADGLESFEATSGPPFGHELTAGRLTPSFNWAERFPNVSHMGQPPSFEFESVVPRWIWY